MRVLCLQLFTERIAKFTTTRGVLAPVGFLLKHVAPPAFTLDGAPCKVLDEPTFFIIYLHASYYFRGKCERFKKDEILEMIRTKGKRGEKRACTERNSMLQK